MNAVNTLNQVGEAVQQAKKNAPDFCTNFFPTQKKLQGWIARGELLGELRDGGTAIFLRKDRHFWRFYYCSPSLVLLREGLADFPALKSEQVMVDIVGNEGSLSEVLSVFVAAGFRKRTKLQRMVWMRPLGVQTPPTAMPAIYAQMDDACPIAGLMERSFDCYGEQLPTRGEVEEAVAAQQILVVKQQDELAGLLFFEAQGVTSTVRIWLVAEKFRSFRVGSVLMQRYFMDQPNARRFILWVATNNDNAIKKYEHYGYKPDGLTDYVLANDMIPR